VSAPAAQPAAPVSAPAPAPAPDPRPELEDLVVAYAQAIESRIVSQIRLVYPGLTASQRQGWEQFFRSARNVRVHLELTRLEVAGAAASLTMSGSWEYEDAGGSHHPPLTIVATAVREADGWRLQSVR
jgi:hypothetical protein